MQYQGFCICVRVLAGVFKGTVLFLYAKKSLFIFHFLTCGKKGKFHKRTANNVHVSSFFHACYTSEQCKHADYVSGLSFVPVFWFFILMMKKQNKKPPYSCGHILSPLSVFTFSARYNRF